MSPELDAIHVLAFGAGVQSTAVLMLALAGELRLDAAVFADTRWEPRAVYAHLERMRLRCEAAGLPLVIASAGDVRRIVEVGQGGALDVPFFVTNQDGSRGMLRRQCTSKLKVAPVRQAIRQLMAERGAKRAVQVFGISADEVGRMRRSGVRYMTNAYPLVERGWRRADCLRYLGGLGIEPPRSACIGCPFHTDAEWRRLRDEAPEEFAEAAAWEADVQRHGLRVDAVPYVHASRVPLAEVDLSTPADHGQLSFDDECEGLCGV